MSTLRERIDAELELKQYMAFRHYFAHAYVLDIDPARLEPLVKKLSSVFNSTKHALSIICNDSDKPPSDHEPLLLI